MPEDEQGRSRYVGVEGRLAALRSPGTLFRELEYRDNARTDYMSLIGPERNLLPGERTEGSSPPSQVSQPEAWTDRAPPATTRPYPAYRRDWQRVFCRRWPPRNDTA